MAFVNLDATLATETDPLTRVTVSSSIQVSFDAIKGSEADAFIYNDMGDSFFSEDFTFRFILNFNAKVVAGYGALSGFAIAKKNTGIDAINTGSAEDDDAIGVGLNYDPLEPGTSFGLFIIEDGASRGATALFVSPGVDYYMTLIRDDDGGTNGTGLITLYTCTGGYYEDGGSLINTQTLSCAPGEQNDFRYVYWLSNVTEVFYGTSWIGNTRDVKYEVISESASLSPSLSPSESPSPSPSASPSKSPSASPSPSPSASPSLGPEFRYLFSKSIRQTIFIGVIPKPEISELEPSDYG